MEVRTLIKRGTDHHVYCEDDLFHFNIGSTYIGAVFDGCSTGTKSHFASALYGKILKAYQKDIIGALDDRSLQEIAEDFQQFLYFQLKNVGDILELETLELLSTMILAVVRKDKAYILVSGDGCVLVDDEEYKIESPGNAPDYLAYHLDRLREAQESMKTYDVTFTKSLSICTDGIYSFTDENKEDVSYSVIKALLKDETLLKSDAMLARKYNLLTKADVTNYDDLSIIRFIL